MKQTRMQPEKRKEDVLSAAMPLAERFGYNNVTRNQIAEAAGVSGASIHYHFGTVGQLRRDLMRRAIHEENLAVIAQGLAAGDPQAQKAPTDLLRQALNSLLQ